MSFEKIFTHGNLVDINVSMWVAERRLRPEDLGIPAEKISTAFSLGHKKLIPYDVIMKFEHMDYLARSALVRYSYPFVFGAARFVLKKNMANLAGILDKIIAEYDAAANDLVKNYSRYKLVMRQEFVAAGTSAYERAKALGGFTKTKDEFLNAFLARIEKSYPPASEVRKRFKIEYVVYQAALPDLSQASYADIAEEDEKIKLMQEAYQRSLTKKVESFVETIVSEQRNKALKTLEKVHRILTNSKFVYEKSLESLKNMIAEYERLDVIQDETFKGMLRNFKLRLVDNFKAKDFKGNSSLLKAMLEELSILITVASDKAGIEALTKNYRERIAL